MPTPSLFDAPAQAEPLEFLNETYPAKTRGIGLLYGENCMILTSTVFAWITRVTDRRTDGIAIAYALSIYAVTCKSYVRVIRIINQKQQKSFWGWICVKFQSNPYKTRHP